MTISELAGRLDGVRWRGSTAFMARCPVHEDRHPSLSVCERDGRILVHCFAGCTIEQICARLGVQTKDLWTDQQAPRSRHRPRYRPSSRPADLAQDLTIRSAHQILATYGRRDISAMSEGEVDAIMATLAHAYRILEREECYG
jgi:hypothetical protein